MGNRKICENCQYFIFYGEKKEDGEYDLVPTCLLERKTIERDDTCKDWKEFEEVDPYGC